MDPGSERGEMATVGVRGEWALAARRIFESHKCAQEREKIGVEAGDGPQEEVRLKIFHPQEECDVWLPRAQGSFIATCVRKSKEASPCGQDRDGGVS